MCRDTFPRPIVPFAVLTFLLFTAYFSQQESCAAEETPAALVFETHVAPILKDRCWKCRAGLEPKKNLRLTTRGEVLRGGESGPVIRIAAAESSLLWEKIASNKIPVDVSLFTQLASQQPRRTADGRLPGTGD